VPPIVAVAEKTQTLEPQAQLIWQHCRWTIERTGSRMYRLVGFRLQGKYQTSSGVFQPYVKANLWHGFGGTDAVLFNTDAITTESKSTSLELGGGIVHDFTKKVSAFAVADYTFDLDGSK
jgi:autotransporter family porin